MVPHRHGPCPCAHTRASRQPDPKQPVFLNTTTRMECGCLPCCLPLHAMHLPSATAFTAAPATPATTGACHAYYGHMIVFVACFGQASGEFLLCQPQDASAVSPTVSPSSFLYGLRPLSINTTAASKALRAACVPNVIQCDQPALTLSLTALSSHTTVAPLPELQALPHLSHTFLLTPLHSTPLRARSCT